MIWWAAAAIIFLIVTTIKIFSAEKRGEDASEIRKSRAGCLRYIKWFVIVVLCIIVIGFILMVVFSFLDQAKKTTIAPQNKVQLSTAVPTKTPKFTATKANVTATPTSTSKPQAIPTATFYYSADNWSGTKGMHPFDAFATAQAGYIKPTPIAFHPDMEGYSNDELTVYGYLPRADGSYSGFYQSPGGGYFPVGDKYSGLSYCIKTPVYFYPDVILDCADQPSSIAFSKKVEATAIARDDNYWGIYWLTIDAEIYDGKRDAYSPVNLSPYLRDSHDRWVERNK